MPTLLIIVLVTALLCLIFLQLGKISEMQKALKGEEDVRLRNSDLNAKLLLLFVLVLFVGTIWGSFYFRNYLLGFGPHLSASVHGYSIDSLMKLTIIITGIVFFATNFALFYFSFKYRERKGGKAAFISHDNNLEIFWTVTPALVLLLLIFKGIVAWNDFMSDVEEGEEFIEVEATGTQFLWYLRYPGTDGVLGKRDYTKITGINPLGQDWTDVKNLDDFMPNELVLPKGVKVRVRITARDVLHNFYLPHFRLKMDAVPGMPTYFVFTPDLTTDEYRLLLSDYPEYQVPADPADPDGPQKWEVFEYELACAELCGKGHYSMKKIVKIVEPEEYKVWVAEQRKTPYYFSAIRGTEEDPFKGQLLDREIEENATVLKSNFMKAYAAQDVEEKVLRLEHINFTSGSAELSEDSKYQLDVLVDLLKATKSKIELGGHTDNTGDPEVNLVLSEARAQAVKTYLVGKGALEDMIVAKGYGQTFPVADNTTEAGRIENRRTEIKILDK